jgi:hypothetical protein
MKNSLGLPLHGSPSSSFFFCCCAPGLKSLPPKAGKSAEAPAAYFDLGTKPPELGLNEVDPGLKPEEAMLKPPV